MFNVQSLFSGLHWTTEEIVMERFALFFRILSAYKLIKLGFKLLIISRKVTILDKSTFNWWVRRHMAYTVQSAQCCAKKYSTRDVFCFQHYQVVAKNDSLWSKPQIPWKESKGGLSWDKHKVTKHKTNISTLSGLPQSPLSRILRKTLIRSK